MNKSELVDLLIQTINSIFSTLFSSIDNTLYEQLDSLVFVDSNILSASFIKSLVGNNNYNSFVYLSNAMLLGVCLFYILRYFYSNFVETYTEKPLQFIFKLFIFAFLINSSYFIIEQLLNIVSLFSSSIQEIGNNITNSEISFSCLIKILNSYISTDNLNFNIFSFDGLLKSFVSIELTTLLFTYSLRYILIQIFILFTPFMFLCLLNSSTTWIFKAWFKCLFSLLILQIVIPVVLIVIISIAPTNKILLVGSIYSLIRINSYIKEIFGGLTLEFSNNFYSILSFFKK